MPLIWGCESCNTAGMAWASHQKQLCGAETEKTYLANIPSIHTLDFSNQLEPHSFIYTHIRVPFGAFKVAWHIFPVGFFHDIRHELLPYTHATGVWANANDIAKVITARVLPYRIMGSLLHSLPNSVSMNIQTATTEEADIVHKLAEGEDPILRPNIPGLGHRVRLWRVPPSNADHSTGWQAYLCFAFIVAGSTSDLGDRDWASAADTILEMSRERGRVSLDIELLSPVIKWFGTLCALSRFLPSSLALKYQKKIGVFTFG